MKVAICDEEKESSELICRLIRQQEPDCETVCFDNGRQFAESGGKFDILLLNTGAEHPGDETEAARTLGVKEKDTILIFMSSPKEHVSKASESSAFRHLRKPVSWEEFHRVFEDACEEVRRMERLREEELFFRTKTRNFTLRKKEILYVESRKRKVDIHTLGEEYTVYAAMKYMEEQLGTDFCRCHRGYLVNMAYVAEYGEGAIRLRNGDIIYASREKYPEFVRAYTQYLERKGIVSRNDRPTGRTRV